MILMKLKSGLKMKPRQDPNKIVQKIIKENDAILRELNGGSKKIRV